MRFVILLIFLVSMVSACKKDTSSSQAVATPASQKRNQKYVGNYKGTWTSQTYSLGVNGPLITKDSIVVIGADADDNKNTTSLSNAPVIQFDASNNAVITHGTIKVSGDSLYYNCGNGGLAAGVNETFKGKKI